MSDDKKRKREDAPPVRKSARQENERIESRIQMVSRMYRYEDDYMPPEWKPAEDKRYKITESVYMYGARGCGKSTAATKMLLELRKLYPIVFCFSGTARNNWWQQVLPDHKVLNVDIITDAKDKLLQAQLEQPMRDILEINMERVEQWRGTKAHDGRTVGNPAVLVINEDIVAANTLRRSKSTAVIMLNGRHYLLCSWTLAQSWIGLDPSQRKNLDRAILFKADDGNVREWVRETFGVYVLRMYDRVVSKEHRAFIIDLKKDTPDNERFSMYTCSKDELSAMIHRNLHLGNNKLWEGIDIAEQKKRLPYVELPSNATFIGQFNKDVYEKAEEAPKQDIITDVKQTVAPMKVDDAPAQPDEAFATCLLL